MKALRIDAVSAKTGVHTKTLRNWASAGLFPRPFKLGPNIAVWDEADVDEWLIAKKKETFGDNENRGPHQR